MDSSNTELQFLFSSYVVITDVWVCTVCLHVGMLDWTEYETSLIFR
jgi:hypothetical protein